jgi:GH24 family phage-related lysozyme (muramidase)
MDFENFVASIVREKFQQFDEEAADAREQQGIAQVGLGTRPMSDRPGLAKEEDDIKVEKISTATRVLSDMSDYYQPEEFPTQEVRVDNAPRFSNINKSTVLDILSANRDGLEKQGIIKMPMGMLRQPDPTLDIDGLQSRILDKLDLRPPEGSEQDIQYGAEIQKLAEAEPDEDIPKGLMSPSITQTEEVEDEDIDVDTDSTLRGKAQDLVFIDKFVSLMGEFEDTEDHIDSLGIRTLGYGVLPATARRYGFNPNEDKYTDRKVLAKDVYAKMYEDAKKTYPAVFNGLTEDQETGVLSLYINAGKLYSGVVRALSKDNKDFESAKKSIASVVLGSPRDADGNRQKDANGNTIYTASKGLSARRAKEYNILMRGKEGFNPVKTVSVEGTREAPVFVWEDKDGNEINRFTPNMTREGTVYQGLDSNNTMTEVSL